MGRGGLKVGDSIGKLDLPDGVRLVPYARQAIIHGLHFWEAAVFTQRSDSTGHCRAKGGLDIFS